jgi:glycosyltransferase involved in cell wall biosynthesis
MMPAHNAGRFIGEAIASVRAQTFQAWRLVVADDGSSDDTLRVAHAAADERVTVLALPHAGPASARNRCLIAAPRSRYVAFLDADDVWSPDKLQAQVAYLDARPDVHAVGSFIRYISSTGQRLGEMGRVLAEQDQARIASAELFPFPLSTTLVRREALEACGGFDERLDGHGAEDLDLYARLVVLGRFACLPAPLASYRIHGHSWMARHAYKANMAARFVRARLAARRAGHDLSWDEFAAGYRLTWQQRRLDLASRAYRVAGVAVSERRHVHAVAYGLVALLASPTYTVPRVYRQRWGESASAARPGEWEQPPVAP